jgi:Flp pilus assembly protein TadB
MTMIRDPHQRGAVISSSPSRTSALERVRVGDRERADAAERLAAHAAAGRLSVEELEARVERANAAVFSDELVALESDLPTETGHSRRPARRAGPPFVPALLVASVLVVAVVSTAAVGHPIFVPIIAALLLWRVGVLRFHGRDRGVALTRP